MKSNILIAEGEDENSKSEKCLKCVLFDGGICRGNTEPCEKFEENEEKETILDMIRQKEDKVKIIHHQKGGEVLLEYESGRQFSRILNQKEVLELYEKLSKLKEILRKQNNMDLED